MRCLGGKEEVHREKERRKMSLGKVFIFDGAEKKTRHRKKNLKKISKTFKFFHLLSYLLTVAPYSESGIPSCSESMSISLSSKSEMRSAFLDSNMKVTTSPVSSAWKRGWFFLLRC